MEAIVLAGGAGTRLRQVVPDLPKAMAPVAGRPFIKYILAFLSQSGFQRAILSLGYMAEKITSYFHDGSYDGMDLEFEIEDTPIGTGGAVRRALSRCAEDHVFIFNGDTYLELDVAEVEALWSSLRKPIIVTRSVADTSRYGRIDVIDRRVARFRDKEASGPGLINAGCYVLPTAIHQSLPDEEAFSFENDFLADAVVTGEYYTHIAHGFFIDIGVPEDYARAQNEMAKIRLP